MEHSTTCQNCHNEFDLARLCEDHRAVMELVNNPDTDILTDLQESVYHGAYCSDCATEFLGSYPTE